MKKVCNELVTWAAQQESQRVAKRRAQWVKWAKAATALWLLPPLALYALGWMTRWVYRGFVPKGAGRSS